MIASKSDVIWPYSFCPQYVNPQNTQKGPAQKKVLGYRKYLRKKNSWRGEIKETGLPSKYLQPRGHFSLEITQADCSRRNGQLCCM